MEILIVCVTYNSYDSLHSYLASVEKAARKINGEVSVFVADNCEEKDFEKHKKDFSKIKVEYYDFPNLGYFGGAFSVINGIKTPLDYDYILITNVDINLDEDFFIELQRIKKDDAIGWIVPDIYSPATKRHYNPYRTGRMLRKEINILIFLYMHPFLMHLYGKTIRVLKHKKHNNNETRQQIYAGHGSCFIFSSKFMNERKFKDYPCFLFGEEIFIAEELNKLNMTTWYEPSVKVYDYDHISTSKMKKKNYYDINLHSIKYLRNAYFN